jgi:predicted nucleotidyltransferase
MKKISNFHLDMVQPRRCIAVAYRGSVAHGMHVPKTDPNSIDDIDLMGVYLAEPSHYVGIVQQKETIERWVDEYDCVFYELKKMVGMWTQFNPNAISFLWNLPEMYLKMDDFVGIFVQNKNLFSSKRAYDSFGGYARGQLNKMQNGDFQGYMGAKRKALVEKFGYDTKKAAHTIRLLRMGEEFLRTQEMRVYRTDDANQLLNIKTGKYTLEEVMSLIELWFDKLDRAYEVTTLPDEPQRQQINDLLVEVLTRYLQSERFKTQPVDVGGYLIKGTSC